MSEANKFLCFDLGADEFAIPLLTVKEVLAYPETTPIPQAPAHFVGIMNLRGSVISILDLRLKLGFKATRTEESSVIIMDFGGFNLGVVVDRVNSVAAFHESEMSPKPDVNIGKASDYIVGVFRRDEKLVLILDLARTLSIEDRAAVGQNSMTKVS